MMHYEISGKLIDGIAVRVHSECGGYRYTLNFLAGCPADTRDQVKVFFYDSGKGGTFATRHGGNPHVSEIAEYLSSNGYRRIY